MCTLVYKENEKTKSEAKMLPNSITLPHKNVAL